MYTAHRPTQNQILCQLHMVLKPSFLPCITTFMPEMHQFKELPSQLSSAHLHLRANSIFSCFHLIDKIMILMNWMNEFKNFIIVLVFIFKHHTEKGHFRNFSLRARRPHNFKKSPSSYWPQKVTYKLRGRFLKILWPFQKILNLMYLPKKWGQIPTIPNYLGGPLTKQQQTVATHVPWQPVCY